MHITIINASPYNSELSNTKTIVKAFETGVIESGRKTVVYSLNNRAQWDNIVRAVADNRYAVFAVPVYAGMIPSLFKEFLEYLNAWLVDDIKAGLKISFILQSAFPETGQRKCCEKYLESITRQFKCSFSGILSHCIYYGLIEAEEFASLTDAYIFFGKRYIENDCTFFFPEAVAFNGSEKLTEKQAKRFVRGFNFMFRHTAEVKGCSADLCDRPLEGLDIKDL